MSAKLDRGGGTIADQAAFRAALAAADPDVGRIVDLYFVRPLDLDEVVYRDRMCLEAGEAFGLTQYGIERAVQIRRRTMQRGEELVIYDD